jgi:small subunit ribosomal protein S4
MGDPRKHRKKYETPVHPWQKARIVEEIKLLKEYGLKNKKEIWKFTSFLKKYKDQAKKLIAMQGSQADIERKQMMDKLKSLGLITPGNETFDAIFSLQIKDVLDRMLQTVLVRKTLARSNKQARQFIVHGHVMIDNKKITSPRYLVLIKEESLINFAVASSLYSSDHPERKQPDTKQKVLKKNEAKSTAKKVEKVVKEISSKKEVTPKEKPVKEAKVIKASSKKEVIPKNDVPVKEKTEKPKEEASVVKESKPEEKKVEEVKKE